MRIHACAGLLLGASACVAPGETHVRLSIFVLAFVLAFRRAVGGESWQVVLQCFPAVICVLLAAYPVVDKFPQPFVGPDRILGRSVVPKEVLDIELMVLGQMKVELQDEEVR